MERKGSTIAQSAKEKFKIVRKSLNLISVFFLRRAAASFFRREDYVHALTFHAGQLLRRAVFFQFFQKTQQKQLAPVFEHDGTAPELYVRFYFVAFAEKIFGVAYFELKVMLARFRAKADFFQLNFYRVCFQFLFPFLLLVKEFVVVHDAHHGRVGVGRYLYHVKPQFFGPFLQSGSRVNAWLDGLPGHLANLIEVFAHEAHFICLDKTVDIVFGWAWSAVERTATAGARATGFAAWWFGTVRFKSQLVSWFGEKMEAPSMKTVYP